MKLPSRFYGIVDPAAGHEPVELARVLLQAGARILQLRLKEASGRDFLAAADRIGRMCRELGTLFIVNDRADITMLADADGVHLGQRDIPLDAGRRVVGSDKVIGISTASVEMARAAEAGGADYIGFGPMYQGGLKNIKVAQGLEKLRAVRAAVKVPVVAIGGITEATMPEVLAAGADAAAIITDVIKAPDIATKVRALLAIE